MGGYRNDGKLLERLQVAVELLWEAGWDGYSDDMEEAIARLREAGYQEAPKAPQSDRETAK